MLVECVVQRWGDDPSEGIWDPELARIRSESVQYPIMGGWAGLCELGESIAMLCVCVLLC